MSATQACGHNGYFKRLKGIVHFYNTRDVCRPVPGTTRKRRRWQTIAAAPEIAENVNRDELGDLHLTPWQEQAIVAFLRTLSDGYQP